MNGVLIGAIIGGAVVFGIIATIVFLAIKLLQDPNTYR